MSDLRFLPPRAALDGWIRRIRHTHDLEEFTFDGLTQPAAIVKLPTHASIELASGPTVDAWVSWELPTVQVVPAGSAPRSLPWRVQGDGKSVLTGTAMIDFSRGVTPDISGLPPAPAEGEGELVEFAYTQARLARRIQTIAGDGLHAQYEAVQALAPYVAAAVRRKNARVAAEVIHGDREIEASEGHPPVVIDAIREEEVIAELCYGKVGQTNPAVVFRALRDAACSDQLASVPVSNYLRGRIDSAAETAIRRLIDDPHLGRRIRRAWKQWIADRPGALAEPNDADPSAEIKEAATAALQQFIDDWNERYPASRIGMKVCVNALTASSDALVDRTYYSPYRVAADDGAQGSLLDQVIQALEGDSDDAEAKESGARSLAAT